MKSVYVTILTQRVCCTNAELFKLKKYMTIEGLSAKISIYPKSEYLDITEVFEFCCDTFKLEKPSETPKKIPGVFEFAKELEKKFGDTILIEI